jgi:hypothetical protein
VTAAAGQPAEPEANQGLDAAAERFFATRLADGLHPAVDDHDSTDLDGLASVQRKLISYLEAKMDTAIARERARRYLVWWPIGLAVITVCAFAAGVCLLFMYPTRLALGSTVMTASGLTGVGGAMSRFVRATSTNKPKPRRGAAGALNCSKCVGCQGRE